MADIDYGQVDIDLDGEVYTLKPTPGAMQKIDRQFGGLRGAMQQVQALSLDAISAIIVAGAGLGQRQAQAIPALVFAAGLINVTGPVSDYLTYLLNPSGKGGDEEGGEGKD